MRTLRICSISIFYEKTFKQALVDFLFENFKNCLLDCLEIWTAIIFFCSLKNHLVAYEYEHDYSFHLLEKRFQKYKEEIGN